MVMQYWVVVGYLLAWKRVPSTELLVQLIKILTGSVCFSTLHSLYDTIITQDSMITVEIII